MSQAGITNAGLRPIVGGEVNSRPQTSRPDLGGPSFRDQLSALQGPAATGAGRAATTPGAGSLRFSNHAIDRMQSRGIRFSPEQMDKIQGAIQKAAGKGAKDTLLLTDDSALIVSIKDNTVVTVMDKAALKENVFTNIDSTVMI